MRHIVPISGKDSLAAALVAQARWPGLPYEYLFTDTEMELPETYHWLAMVEKKTGWPILRVGRSLADYIREKGGFLPTKKQRYCTSKCKIQPMEKLLGNDECTVYYGLRADEPRTGYIPAERARITPAYPLRECGIDLQGVFSILDAQGLTPPDFFWPRLYKSVAERLGEDWLGWEGRLSRMERLTLFAGRSRANCSMCIFQRRYEFLWLLETHPDLFAQAESLEKDHYSLQKGFPLRKLHQPGVAARVFQKRVNQVVEAITAKFQTRLFPLPMDNELALTSCGLLCGK